MEEGMEWLMFLQSFQRGFNLMHLLFPKWMTSGKGGRWEGNDNKNIEEEGGGVPKKDSDSYYPWDHSE
jgi:hypothetical protein